MVWKCLFIASLVRHPYSEILWDMSEKEISYHQNRTKDFKDCQGVVAFIDGIMLCTLHPSDPSAQNKEYSNWKSDCFRKMILVWNTDGRCVDTGVNFPGTFHDSKATNWVGLYENILCLPEGAVVVADSAFDPKVCGGKLKSVEIVATC